MGAKLSNPWVQPNPTRSTWVGLDSYDELGWVGFFLTTMVSWVEETSQLNSTQSMHTPSSCHSNFILRWYCGKMPNSLAFDTLSELALGLPNAKVLAFGTLNSKNFASWDVSNTIRNGMELQWCSTNNMVWSKCYKFLMVFSLSSFHIYLIKHLSSLSHATILSQKANL